MKDLAHEFNITHSIVSRLLAVFQKTGICTMCTQWCHSAVWYSKKNRYIVILVKRNRYSKASQLAHKPCDTTGTKISRKTFARCLKNGEPNDRRRAVCVSFSRREHSARLQCCRTVLLCSVQNIFSLFSDCSCKMMWSEGGSAAKIF